MASQWESEGDRKGMGGGNAEAARRLCMRALRFLKGKKGEKEGMEGPEEAIWREWIRVEVSFVEKLRGRWQVLGLEKGKGGKEEIIRVKGANGEADEGDEEEEVQLPTTEDGDAEDAQLAEKMTEQAKSGQEALFDGAIVRLVIDNLLKCELRFPSFTRTILTPCSQSLRALDLRLQPSPLDPPPSCLPSPPLAPPARLHLSLHSHHSSLPLLPCCPAHPRNPKALRRPLRPAQTIQEAQSGRNASCGARRPAFDQG